MGSGLAAVGLRPGVGLTWVCVWLAMGSAGAGMAQTRGAKTPKKTEQELKAAMAAAPIEIVRKPGTEAGEAQMTLDGKVRKIAPHAVAVWKVRQGTGVLVEVVQAARKQTPKLYVLRYYDLDSGRRRDLGQLPFTSATLVETEAKDGRWAFALGGRQRTDGTPVVVVGDVQALPGLLPNATSPAFHEDTSLAFAQSGQPKAASLGLLLGRDLHEIYAPPTTAQLAPQYLQVFPMGTALVELQDGSLARGSWTTDGETLRITGNDSKGREANYAVAISGLSPVKGVPAAQRFGVRLTEQLSSRTTHEGDTVKAVLITPVVVDGEILIPAGSSVEGKVVQANGVGWGFKHETASLTVAWNRATTQDGRTLGFDAQVFAVENAQEKVNAKGKIQGIRSTGTIGSSVQNGVLTFAGIDPVAYAFATAGGSAVLGFAEPEILYPGGTELILEMVKPLITATAYPPSVLPMERDAAGREQLQAFVRTLPFRTRTKGSNKDSDVTNLVFVGEPAALEHAFAAAGWLPTDELYAGSTFKTVKTLTGNQTYTQAPMSVLLLNERAPLLTLSKTTNTFSARHHLRIFPTNDAYAGHTVMTASSTQDTGIAFSRKQKTFIHVIDQHIDNERSKVINDLVFTGCVESLDLVERPWVPRDAYNSTGDQLLTDGEAAVLKLNACEHPRTTPTTAAPAPNRMQRSTRDTALIVRNSLYRGNFIYQGIFGGLKAHDYFKEQSELPRDPGVWRKTDASGADYIVSGKQASGTEPDPFELHRRPPGDAAAAVTPEDRALVTQARLDHKWDPPRYEFALQGGYVHMRSSYLSAVGVLEESSVATNPTYFLFLADNVGDGWAAGGSVTVNSWKHFSNEFSYFRQQVKYELGSVAATIPAGGNVILDDSDLDTERIGLVTRQFEYNLLIHATKPTSRWRPYAAVGPVLQLVALNGAPLNKPAGVYTIGLKNIGLIKAAFDFGNTPPLDGGGIFHIGLQYGGGIKYRVTPRFMARADWRETWAKNPDIIAQSYEDYNPNALDETYTTEVIRVAPEKKFIKDRFTLGVAFTF